MRYRLSLREFRALAFGALFGAAVLHAAHTLPNLPWKQSTEILAAQVQRVPQDPETAYLLDRAERLHLSYSEVVGDAKRHKGDPVVWDVQFNGHGAYFANEDVNSPVTWTNLDSPPNCSYSGHHSISILALIEGAKDNHVQLRYVACF